MLQTILQTGEGELIEPEDVSIYRLEYLEKHNKYQEMLNLAHFSKQRIFSFSFSFSFFFFFFFVFCFETQNFKYISLRLLYESGTSLTQ